MISNQQIVEMPLSNRNVLQLDTFVPGVLDFGATSAPATQGSVAFGRFEANGGPTNSNEFMLDGASDVVANLTTNVVPTIDALSESNILTSSVPAEFEVPPRRDCLQRVCINQVPTKCMGRFTNSFANYS